MLFEYHVGSSDPEGYFVSIIIEFVVQISTRDISFHIGMIPVLSIYDKNSIKFSYNI